MIHLEDTSIRKGFELRLNSPELMGVSPLKVQQWWSSQASRNLPYHNDTHVSYLFNVYSTYTENPSLEIMAAIWLHDIIYDPTKSDNEERSADFAEEALMPSRVDIPLVVDIILNTKAHVGGRPEFDEFNDLDLHILSLGGGKPTRFKLYWQFYARRIQLEYGFVPPDVYAQKRIEFLEGLDEKTIFKTSRFKDRETTAHLNIRDEIAFLNAL